MFRAIRKSLLELAAMAIFVVGVFWIWPVKSGLTELGSGRVPVETKGVLKDGRPTEVEGRVYWNLLYDSQFSEASCQIMDGVGKIHYDDFRSNYAGADSVLLTFKWSDERHRFLILIEDARPTIDLELTRKATGSGAAIGFHATRRWMRRNPNRDKFLWPDMPPGVEGFYQWYDEEEAAGEWPGDREGTYTIRFEGDGKPRTEVLLIVKVGVGE